MTKLLIPIVAAVALASTAAFAWGQSARSEPIGITRAVAIAEQDTGARALDAELDGRRDGTLVYEVELATTKALHEVHIDARTGRIIAKRAPRLASTWARWFDDEEMQGVAQTRPLADLLAALERRSNGSVREVSFDVENGQARYEVEISTQAGIADIYLDPKTGQRLSLVYDD